jgi:hypothetical protein
MFVLVQLSQEEEFMQKVLVLGDGPRVQRLGSLNHIVQQAGNNDDDGNRWQPKPDDGRKPPSPLAKGPLAYLLHQDR